MWCTSAAVLPVAFRFGIGLFIISSFVRLLVVLSGRESCGVSSFFLFIHCHFTRLLSWLYK